MLFFIYALIVLTFILAFWNLSEIIKTRSKQSVLLMGTLLGSSVASMMHLAGVSDFLLVTVAIGTGIFGIGTVLMRF